jgi:CheY-like chemotaxis protein
MNTPPITALVVDDEPHIRYVLEYKLAGRGFRVFTASNGKIAFETACREQPDIVITDYQMPGGDGLTFARELAADPQTASIPVVMLTARGHRVATEQRELTNIVLMLDKPFSPRELEKQVFEILGHSAGGHEKTAA